MDSIVKYRFIYNEKTTCTMRNKFRVLLITSLLQIAPFVIMAQQPPHPNGGISPGAGNGPVGGGAPIENGLIFLIVLAMLYGYYRLFKLKNSNLNTVQTSK
jgi:hypothetical protein